MYTHPGYQFNFHGWRIRSSSEWEFFKKQVWIGTCCNMISHLVPKCDKGLKQTLSRVSGASEQQLAPEGFNG